MTPALDPKQGSFLKRGKYSGSWREAKTPAKSGKAKKTTNPHSPEKKQMIVLPKPRFSRRSQDLAASIGIDVCWSKCPPDPFRHENNFSSDPIYRQLLQDHAESHRIPEKKL